MARDAGTKQDKPSAEEGKGPDPKLAEAAEQSGQAAAEEKADAKAKAPKPKAKRKPATKKSEGTAAAKTKVDKPAAESALEGAEVPGEAEKAEAEAEAKPKPRRKPAAKKKAEAEAASDDAPEAAAEAPSAEAAPAKKPRRGRAKKDEAKAEPKAEAPKPAKSARAARRRRRDVEPRVTVRATAKFVRSSPRKARLLTDHIKGKSVDEARAILAFSPRSVAEDWRKLLESAIANAENNHDLVGDDLRVLNATADDGPTLKRFRPRAMGRATRIRKRTSHLTITLTPKE
jgi:ribosomal protein L22